jgi:hypothetical protein
MIAMGMPKIPMFENAIAYDQDALFLGGGLFYQLSQRLSLAITYVHALWYQSFPNVKTISASISLQFPRPSEDQGDS